MPAMLADLARLQPDVIVAFGTAARIAAAARRAGTAGTAPIVLSIGTDPGKNKKIFHGGGPPPRPTILLPLPLPLPRQRSAAAAAAQPWKIMFIARRDWAAAGHSI